MSLKKTHLALVSFVLLGASLGAMAQPAAHDAEWQKNHPRRAEVNDRLKNQDKRINKEEKSGQIDKAQARQLHKEDHQIRKEERADAKANGGHITKGEQQQLNRQENGVSKQIGQ